MKKTVFAGIAALIIAVSPLVAVPAASAAGEPPPHAAGQILVKFADDHAADGVLRQHGLANGPTVGSTGAHLIKVPAGAELRLVQALSSNPAVEYAEPDAIARAVTDDQYFDRQYALQNTGQSFTNTAGTITVPAGKAGADVGAVGAWSTTTGGGIPVAVLDTGVATDNHDIWPHVTASANFSTSTTQDDMYGHGTHVAGIVAAIANNTIGVAGVCPSCTILNGKVLDDNGSGTASAIARGIDWAVKNGAKVINMSLAMRVSSRTLETAVNNAWNSGVVIVAAAGNTGAQAKMYPAAYSNVIAVAATDNNDAKASFSTYGAKWVDVAAPGVSVYSTFPNHPFALQTTYNRSESYDIGSGTSMASPIVAATAALALSAHSGYSNAQVRAKVESSADRIPGTGSYWAYGRVDANAAVH
ncbi:S8 family serine peptidase [Sinomonas cellulolyticus]|uniref:S8 family serine peptidase n=1 Tax=Sinomonas cellulolyticus TaxID=2801916 RepID=A0ABS1JXJ7_9MICC|nr:MULTISPECIES: S8 family serine peptidase [Sinomonas]MBL0703898.1 S8 family serine peptidase [Sinomonas cellulolyticus]